jgi:hypothetical protein
VWEVTADGWRCGVCTDPCNGDGDSQQVRLFSAWFNSHQYRPIDVVYVFIIIYQTRMTDESVSIFRCDRKMGFSYVPLVFA